MRGRSLIALLLAVGTLCAPALADDSVLTQDPRYAELARVGSIFAQQPVTVTCQTPQDDYELYTAWGYVFLPIPEIHMGVYLCDAAVRVNDPNVGMSVRALAVMVLTHEAYHLRKSWGSRGDEGRTQCKAIRHFRYAAQFLGASPGLATQLRSYALVHHWHLAAKYPEYFANDCKVPKP